jgi:hypothetical protein
MDGVLQLEIGSNLVRLGLTEDPDCDRTDGGRRRRYMMLPSTL